MTSTAALTDQCAAGDALAFETLFDQYHDTVFRLARRLLRTTPDAEDATAETFLQVHRKLHTFRGEADFAVWLHQVALNVCRQQSRRRRRASAGDTESGPVVETLPDPAPGPQELALARDLQREAVAALDRLPDKLREPLVLHYLQGLTYAQTAQVLKRPVGTVQFHVHLGLKALRKAIDGAAPGGGRC